MADDPSKPRPKFTGRNNPVGGVHEVPHKQDRDDDRDNRRPIQPRPGVIDHPRGADSSGRADEPPERWDGADAPITAVRPGETQLDAIARRSHDTKQAARATLTGVDQLRQEVREDVGKLSTRVDGVILTVSDMRVTVEGQNKQVLGLLEEQKKAREQSGMLRLTAQATEAELQKAKTLADIGERVAWGKTWRGTVMKIVLVVTGIATLAGAYFLGKA